MTITRGQYPKLLASNAATVGGSLRPTQFGSLKPTGSLRSTRHHLNPPNWDHLHPHSFLRVCFTQEVHGYDPFRVSLLHWWWWLCFQIPGVRFRCKPNFGAWFKRSKSTTFHGPAFWPWYTPWWPSTASCLTRHRPGKGRVARPLLKSHNNSGEFFRWSKTGYWHVSIFKCWSSSHFIMFQSHHNSRYSAWSCPSKVWIHNKNTLADWPNWPRTVFPSRPSPPQLARSRRLPGSQKLGMARGSPLPGGEKCHGDITASQIVDNDIFNDVMVIL